MSSAAIDQNVIRATSETLGKVIKQVPLTEKLLSRPPFKFIHDIIKEIIRNNGFLSGLYTDDELSSENVRNKEAKTNFLQKAIDAIGFVTNKSLDHIKAGKIVAGLEPEKTNELLQILGRCVISRKESSLAVKRVLKGEKPGAANVNLSVNEDLVKQNSVSQRKNSISTNSSETKQNNKPTNSINSSNKINQNRSINSPKKPNDNKSGKKPAINLATKVSEKSRTISSSVDSTKKAVSSIQSNSKKKSTQQQTKVVSSKSNAQKTHSQSNARFGQEKIAKPVIKSSTNKAASVNKRTDLVDHTYEESSNKNRTLSKEELNSIQASKQNDRANDEVNLKERNSELRNGEVSNNKMTDETFIKESSKKTASELISLENTNQNVITKSITDQELNKSQNENEELEGIEDEKTAENEKLERIKESANVLIQSATSKQKFENTIDRQQMETIIPNEKNNEISLPSAKRPIVQKQNDHIDESKKLLQRPITATRPLTARAAPPRAVSRRALREETNNVLEMVGSSRPQTAVKKVLVSNLIKESNDLSDEDEDDSLNEKLIEKNFGEKRGSVELKENTDELEEEIDFKLNKSKSLNKDEIESGEKGSLVKKLLKSKQELEGDIEQAQISSASLVRSNRDIERLKEHIQTLTKLANPLSKLLDSLQEDIDLMLLEEKNWLDEQQRNEQQLLVLREQMDEELRTVNSQIASLNDQIQQEKDNILSTNISLLINQAKLKDIVKRMIEN